MINTQAPKSSTMGRGRNTYGVEAQSVHIPRDLRDCSRLRISVSTRATINAVRSYVNVLGSQEGVAETKVSALTLRAEGAARGRKKHREQICERGQHGGVRLRHRRGVCCRQGVSDHAKQGSAGDAGTDADVVVVVAVAVAVGKGRTTSPAATAAAVNVGEAAEFTASCSTSCM